MGGLVRGRPDDRAWRDAWFVSIFVWPAWGRTGGRRGIGASSFRIIFGQVAE